MAHMHGMTYWACVGCLGFVYGQYGQYGQASAALNCFSHSCSTLLDMYHHDNDVGTHHMCYTAEFGSIACGQLAKPLH